jgi:putative endonuclease
MTYQKEFGGSSEHEAACYLESRGLKIVARNFRVKQGEVDLIAKDNDTWVFVEVKARRSRQEISALDTITPAKQRRITMAALMYMKKNFLMGQSMRFDVVTLEAGQVDWIPSAFEPSSRYTF